jgi:hypothetical protein
MMLLPFERGMFTVSYSDHDVQIAVGTRVEPPQNCYIAQIPGRTDYARTVRQPFPSNTGLCFSREMAVSTIGPFQMLGSLCVIYTNFTILRHFLFKLWCNEILGSFILTRYYVSDNFPKIFFMSETVFKTIDTNCTSLRCLFSVNYDEA